VQEALNKHEAAGTTDDPEYEAAVQVFYRRHLLRMDERPEYFERSFAKIGHVYNVMNGPSEFHVIGKLKNWDIRDRLGEISVPTIVISGKHDEATPLIAETVHQGIPGSEWVLFENSSHSAHAEEPERYIQVATEFMSRAEAQVSGAAS
jgi:proline-specific peptidase